MLILKKQKVKKQKQKQLRNPKISAGYKLVKKKLYCLNSNTTFFIDRK